MGARGGGLKISKSTALTPTDPKVDRVTAACKLAHVFTKRTERMRKDNLVARHEGDLSNQPGCKQKVRALS